jgi:hypothetical protein
MTQTKVGWRPYVATTTTTASTLLTSIYGVWNADKLGTSLDSSIYGVYNGDNANDTSGNARNGTNVNGVTFTTGKVGNAFTFNGSNYISLPDNSLNLTGQISVSLWWYVDPTNDQVFIGNRQKNGGGVNHGWQFRYNSSGFVFRVMNSTTDTEWGVSSSLPANSTGTWIHLMVIKNSSSNFKLYVNNVEYNMTGGISAEPAYLTNQKCTIGNIWTGTFFDSYMKNGSKIDALTVWNKALTTDERIQLYNAGTGAEYPFSSQLLPSPNDAVSANHGTLMNGCTFTDGKIGKAFTFDGVNDYVALPDNSLNLTNKFSYSFWIKSTDTTNYTVIVGNIQGARAPYGFAHGYQYWLEYGKIVTGYRDGNDSTNYRIESTSVANGSWNHIVITTDITNRSTGIKIYINGNLNASGTTPANLVYSSPMKPCIGARNQAGVAEYFLSNGTMLDAVSVWNKELTSTEITELYNSGTGKQYPYVVGAPSSLLTNLYAIYKGENNANDLLGNYNGTAVGGLTYTAGKNGNAFTFNGTNSAIRLPVNSMSFTNDFSISTWINIPSGYSGLNSITILWNVNGEWFNNPKGFRLGIYGSQVNFAMFNGTNTYNSLNWNDSNATTIKENSGWVHIVAVRKKSTSSKIYVNGVLKASNTDINDAVYSSTYQTPNIGNAYMLNSSGTVTNNDSWAFNGSKIDELNTWTKELTATDVTDLYNSGAGKFYPTF